jgi:hypothetical protein
MRLESIFGLTSEDPAKIDRQFARKRYRHRSFDCGIGDDLAIPDRLRSFNLLGAATLNDSNQNHDDCDDQEDVNESAHGVRTYEAQSPENDQDYCYRFEHFFLSLFSRTDNTPR